MLARVRRLCSLRPAQLENKHPCAMAVTDDPVSSSPPSLLKPLLLLWPFLLFANLSTCESIGDVSSAKGLLIIELVSTLHVISFRRSLRSCHSLPQPLGIPTIHSCCRSFMPDCLQLRQYATRQGCTQVAFLTSLFRNLPNRYKRSPSL